MGPAEGAMATTAPAWLRACLLDFREFVTSLHARLHSVTHFLSPFTLYLHETYM